VRACPGCGLSIADAAVFCAVCGAGAGSSNAGPAPSRPLSARARRCALCGQPESPAEVASFRLCGCCRDELEQLPLAPGDVGAFLAFAAEHILPATAETLEDFRREVRIVANEPAARLRAVQACVSAARQSEGTDAVRAAALYRQAILTYLDASEDPLGAPGVSGQLAVAFDRLSRVLETAGLHAEALEEIDCAASLGVLDRCDHAVEDRRQALVMRRDRIRLALAGAGDAR
jgi:hypothetical protein